MREFKNGATGGAAFADARRAMSVEPRGESRAACVSSLSSSSSVREMHGCVGARVHASRRNVNDDAVDAVRDECAPVRDDGFRSLGVQKYARDGGCDDKDVIIRALIDRVTVLEGANDALRAELEEARTRAARRDALERDEGGAVSTSVSSLPSVSAAAAAAAAAVVVVGPKAELAESPSRASRRVVWSHAAETMFTPDAVVLSPSAGRAFASGHGCKTPVSPVRRVRMNDDEVLRELEPLAAAFAKCDVSPSGPFDVLCDSSREHDATFEAHVEVEDDLHRSLGAHAMNMYESESASSDAEDADECDENASPTRGWVHDAPTTPPSKPITLKTPMAPLRHQHFRVRGGVRESSRIDADADASRPSAECVSPRILF